MNKPFDRALESLKDDGVLGGEWRWSRTGKVRVSSDNWRMTATRDSIEIRPTRTLRGSVLPVTINVGEYAVLKMIVLTHFDNIEECLEETFKSAQ